MNYRNTLLLSCALSLLSLIVPFVWLEVGPEGYKVYGPTVPHVYIYGGYITGKDLGFWGISFALIVQLSGILLFTMMGAIARHTRLWQNSMTMLIFQLLLLALFPFWLKAYVSGVICNSDGADLSVHWHVGLIFYASMVVLTIVAVIQMIKMKLTERGSKSTD